jgi:hypothetical protein
MPDKQVKRLLGELKQNEQEKLNLNDQGINNILDLPELCKLIIVTSN